MRRNTKKVAVGACRVGGGEPIALQSMCNTKTGDTQATLRQILELEERGCEIIRVAVPDKESAEALKTIVPKIHIPLVADIHFDYRLALMSLENGASKVRINPGNLGGEEPTRLVVQKAAEVGAALRVGVNMGSLEQEIADAYGRNARGLVESALKNMRLVESFGLDRIVVSLKASDVMTCVEAYELFSEKCAYPLHIGVTETGDVLDGAIKSAVGLGILLKEGIGDTLRVSLTGDPVKEIEVGQKILSSLGIRRFGPEVISCPTCGRTDIDLMCLSKEVKEGLSGLKVPIRVAVMGCVVNGPGEAKDADYGITGGKGAGIIFRKGEVVRRVAEEELVRALLTMIEQEERAGSGD